MRLAIAGLSSGIRRQAKKLNVTYKFLFVSANGDQLREITALIESGAIRPVVGGVHSFNDTFNDTVAALSALENNRIRGKAVVSSP